MRDNILFLVIDDMSTTAKITSNALRLKGFNNILMASDGDKAWEIILHQFFENAPIECVVSDWNMPKLSGLELLKKIRGDFRFMKLPFIMTTNESDKMQILTAIQSGVNGYFIKPVNGDELYAKISNIFQKQ